MRVHFLIVALLLAVLEPVESEGKDIHKIDSLKNQLKRLDDTARIDCLNQLTYEYILGRQKDSALNISTLAYKESIQLNYIRGIAEYFSLKSSMARHFNDDFAQSELLAKEALTWYEKTSNKDGLYKLYDLLWISLFAQGKYDQSIVYAQRKHKLAQANGDEVAMNMALDCIGTVYKEAGNYEKAFYFYEEAHRKIVNGKIQHMLPSNLFSIGELYLLIEDYSSALKYFRQGFRNDNPIAAKMRMETGWDIWVKMEFAEIFSHLGEFDSAWHYYRLFEPVQNKEVFDRIFLVSTGECYYMQKNYQLALQNFLKALPVHQKLHDRNQIMRTLLDIAKTYLKLGNDTAALRYGSEGLQLALSVRSKHFIRNGYHILYSVFDHLQKTDSAYGYYKLYNIMKDSVASDQVKAKFAAFSYEQEIEVLNKEKEMQKSRLDQQSFLKNILIIGFFILVFLVFIVFRNIMLKRRNEKQKLEHNLALQKIENEKETVKLKQHATELEMQALRAQMNPHFIFNCLNAINRYILKNETEDASDYLTKFSRLIRMVLQSSSQKTISLYDELETLKLYIELEQLRFQEHFDYRIDIDEDIDIESVSIPPMLLQPFVENAIWHGLMHKKEKGNLMIAITQMDGMLRFTIRDNGIGRKKAGSIEVQSTVYKKSMGMYITGNRLKMLNEENEEKIYLNIIDLEDEDGHSSGTEVIIEIPVIIKRTTPV